MEHAAPGRLRRQLAWLRAQVVVRRIPADHRMPTADRAVLERRVLPALLRDDRVHTIVFAGCSGATAWYPSVFDTKGAPRFVTVDPDPDAARHGSPSDHRVARVEDLASEVGLRGNVDVVILNGVFGYGIDGLAAQRHALQAASTLLRHGGRLLLGYRDSAEHRDLEPEALAGLELVAAPIPGVGRTAMATGSANGHAFSAYAKR